MDGLGEDNKSIAHNFTINDFPNYFGTTLPSCIITSVVVFIVAAILIGIPGNTLVLAVLMKNTTKTSTDWFIIFIAVCDLLSLGLNGPIDVLKYQTELWAKIGSPALCKIHYYILNGLFINSNFLILFVGVDRYLKTCRPHEKYFTPNRAFWFCVGVTISSFLCATPSFFGSTASSTKRCIFDSRYDELRMVFMTCLIAILFLSCLVLIILYSRIALLLRRRACADKIRRDKILKALENVAQVNAICQSFGNDGRNRQSQTKFINNTVHNTSTDDLEIKGPSANQTTTRDAITCNTMQEAARCEPTKKDKPSRRPFRLGINRRPGRVHPSENYRGDAVDGDPRDINTGRAHTVQIEESDARRRVRLASAHNPCKRASKTTKIMFAITLLYIVSGVIPALTATFLTETNLRHYKEGLIVITIFLRMYTINNFANPLLYIAISSSFRKKTMKMIKSCVPW